MSTAAKFRDLNDMLQKALAAHAARPCFGLRRGEGWQWMTYGDVGKLIDKARGGLASIGIGKGDRVAVIANNRLEWAVGQYATYQLGGVYTAMYEAQLDKEWKYILADAGAKVCLCANAQIKARVEKLKAELPALEHVVCFEGTGPGSWAEILETGEKKPVPVAQVSPDDVANFIYTSGTTGNPKGVVLSHGNLVFGINTLHEVLPLTHEDRSLAFLPWAHVFGGCIELHSMVSLGASLGICEDVNTLVDSLGQVKPTILLAVPRIWNRIYDGVQKQMAGKPKIIRHIFAEAMRAQSAQKRNQPVGLLGSICLAIAKKIIFSKIVAKFGGRLRFAVSGAAALSKDVAEFIDNLGVVVFEGYGLSECCGVACANRPGAVRIGSVGQALPGIQIELDKTVVGADAENGEILIIGPSVMREYHGHAEQTKETLTPTGGLRTGDLGRLDADGFLYITGRVKEIYKLENGKYVAPAPIEETITLSPLISQVMVHGQDKPFNVAVVVPDLAALEAWAKEHGLGELGKDALCAHDQVRAALAAEIEKYSAEIKGYERVKKFLVTPEEFSTANDLLTPTLKVKRRNVITKYGARLEALYG